MGERRRYYAGRSELVEEILEAGADKAWVRAEETMRQVSEVMGVRYRKVRR